MQVRSGKVAVRPSGGVRGILGSLTTRGAGGFVNPLSLSGWTILVSRASFTRKEEASLGGANRALWQPLGACFGGGGGGGGLYLDVYGTMRVTWMFGFGARVW